MSPLCVVCWWNPLAWWARRALRASEELCCDAPVLSALQPNRRTYASSLLTAVELLAAPALRPPALASGVNSGGLLERRIQMIVSQQPIPASRWAIAVILLSAVGLLPLGVASAQDPDYEAVANRLIEAVEEGELTAAQAEAMMGALARARFAERLAAARSHEEHDEHEHDEDEHELVAYARKLGVGERMLDGVKERLTDAGIEDEQLEGAIGGLLKLVHAMQEGDARKHRDKFAEYFAEELDLEDEQVEMLMHMARRIAQATGKARKGHERELSHEDHFARMGITREEVQGLRERLAKADLDKRQIEHGLGIMLRNVHHLLEGGKKMHPELRKHAMGELDMTEKQVELVGAISGAIARRVAKVKAQLEQYGKELEAAVKAGKMTEADAKQKWAAMMEKLRMAPAGKQHGKGDVELQRAKERIWDAVRRGELTEEEAKGRWEAYLKARKRGNERSRNKK